jgi:hypothetical protein
MNGRIYDPTLGRFLQADPHIQAPSNSQNYNRYSYVLNNPMSYTDPSGYFFKALGKFVKKYWRQIAAIAVTYFTAGVASGWATAWGFSGAAAGAVSGAIAGAAGGFVATGSLRGALVGAFSGAAFGAIGASSWGNAGKFAASGAVGGVMSDLQGGKFGHGFWSAGLGTALGGQFSSDPVGQVLASAVVGGTISKLTGGKFGNGAMTAAFAAALRANWKAITNQRPSHYDRALTPEEVAQAKSNYETVKGQVIKDSKAGVLDDTKAMDVSPGSVEDIEMKFVNELKSADGEYIAGHVSTTDRGSYVKISDFEISAHGCFTMSECYTTFGHESRHTSSFNMKLIEGWGPNTGNSMWDKINVRTHMENEAERWGQWYAKQHGF